MRVVLDIRSIWTFYGNIRVLAGLSLRAEPGEIVSLIGANGAGKTTLLNSISGLVPARRGQILLDGRDITARSPEAIVAAGISHVPERRQVFGTLSVYDNLLLGAYRRLRRERRKVKAEIEQVFDLFPILKERYKQPAGTLSGGEQQMLAIGRGLMARPKVLLLDEPSLGLAPILVQEIFRVIKELSTANTTILLVEQNARAALKISDRNYILETGRIILSGTTDDLIANQKVWQAYLGQGTENGSQ
jgi:branched-chain amino acid transport system ATP-binding protein